MDLVRKEYQTGSTSGVAVPPGKVGETKLHSTIISTLSYPVVAISAATWYDTGATDTVTGGNSTFKNRIWAVRIA